MRIVWVNQTFRICLLKKPLAFMKHHLCVSWKGRSSDFSNRATEPSYLPSVWLLALWWPVPTILQNRDGYDLTPQVATPSEDDLTKAAEGWVAKPGFASLGIFCFSAFPDRLPMSDGDIGTWLLWKLWYKDCRFKASSSHRMCSKPT